MQTHTSPNDLLVHICGVSKPLNSLYNRGINSGRCGPLRVLLGLSRFYNITLDQIHLNHLSSLGVMYIMFTCYSFIAHYVRIVS